MQRRLLSFLRSSAASFDGDGARIARANLGEKRALPAAGVGLEATQRFGAPATQPKHHHLDRDCGLIGLWGIGMHRCCEKWFWAWMSKKRRSSSATVLNGYEEAEKPTTNKARPYRMQM